MNIEQIKPPLEVGQTIWVFRQNHSSMAIGSVFLDKKSLKDRLIDLLEPTSVNVKSLCFFFDNEAIQNITIKIKKPLPSGGSAWISVKTGRDYFLSREEAINFAEEVIKPKLKLALKEAIKQHRSTLNLLENLLENNEIDNFIKDK